MNDDVIILTISFLVVIGLLCFSLWSMTHVPPANVPCPDCASATQSKSHDQTALSFPNHGGYGTFQPASEDGGESSKFQRLPPEILDQVMDPLSPLSLRCLRMTCRRFYYHHGHLTTNLNAQGKFHLRCVLERDQSSFQGLVCGFCRVYHDRSQFFPSEL